MELMWLMWFKIFFMKPNLIFDASPLTRTYKGWLNKDGIYRVTDQILKKLIESKAFTIYLFDSHFEREFKKYVLSNYAHVKLLRTDYSYNIYLDMANNFEQKQPGLSGFKLFLCKVFKKLFRWFGKFLSYLGQKRQKRFSFLKDGDIYFSTLLPFPNNFEFIKPLHKAIIVHDLIPLIHPEFSWKGSVDFAEKLMKSISNEDTVFCVSQFSKNDLLRFKPDLKAENIIVTYLAGADCFKPVDSIQKLNIVREKYAIPNAPYFLSVSTVSPRKNIRFLITAYEELLKDCDNEQPYPVLVLTGTHLNWDGPDNELIFKDMARINESYPNAVILTGFVPDEELVILYSNTNALVYPSLYEGFGIPPLEAMQCGAPVITSNVTSLPEVVGDAGIQISPDDVEGLKNAMLQCLDETFVSEMRKKSLERAKEFSWTKMADIIIQTLNRVIYK